MKAKDLVTNTVRTLLLTIVACFGVAQGTQAATTVSGAITANTTWSLAQSPYQVTADISVENGATLAIEAGVVVSFDAARNLTVTNGALSARGTAGQPITFTSSLDVTGSVPAAGDWGQIRFLAATNDSATIIEHAQIRYGKGITVQAASPTFNYLQIANNLGSAISIDLNSSPKGIGNEASGNTLNGISVPAGDVQGAVTWGIKGIPYVVATGVVSVGNTPALSALNISEIQQGETINAILSGTRLTGAQSVSLSSMGTTAIVQSGATDTSVPIQLTASPSAALGAANIELQVAAGRPTLTGAVQIIQPQPTVTSLTPNSVYATQAGNVLNVTGKNFVAESVIRLDGVDLTTTYASASSLSTTLPVLTAGNKSITVKQPDPLSTSTFTFLTSKPAVLSVTVPPLSISPALVSQIQGVPFDLTVAIPFTAPAGGMTVNLASTTPSIATVPASITILEGATTATVPVTTSALGGTVITASRIGFANATANITVVPPPSLTISPAALDIGAGRSANLTVTSSKIAGSGGVAVALTSSDATIATVPPSLVIPAGASSATVQLSALATGVATVSAQASTYTSGTSSVTVHPATLSLPAGAVVSPGVTRAILLTLSDAAPAGGVVVSLISSNTAVMTVPVSVAVPEGQKTASVDLTGVAIGSATLTASAAGYQSATSAITVDTINISLGTSNIALLLNGSASYAVTLSSPAPAGGLAVSLAIADPTVASVSPATITVPAGQTTGGAVKATVKGLAQGATTLTASASGVNGTTVSVNVSGQVAGIDLVMTNASIGTIVTNQNGTYTIPVTYKVTNNGTVTALPNWVDLAYLSSNGVLDTASVLLAGEHGRTTALAAGASYTVTVSYTTNTAVAPGNYTVFIKADGHDPSGSYHASISGYPTGTVTDNGNVAEANETNNAQGLAVTLSRPDLAVSNASIGTIVTNQNGTYTIPVTYKVTNNGTVTALPNWVDLAYLSSNGVLDTASVLLAGEHGRTTALAAGASYTVTVSYTTNTAVAPGNYTVFIKADGHDPSGSYHASISGYPTGTVTDNGNVAEANETNNAQGLAVTLSRPDLAVSNASIGTIVTNQNGTYTIPVTYKVTNNGTVTALPNWVDLAYLSSNGVLDTASVLLAGEHGRTTALAAGASYTVTVSYTTNTAVAPGNYTVFIKADGHDPSGSYHASISGYPTGTVTDNGNVAEANETNNAQGLAVTLSRPDLAVSNASIGTIVTNQNGTYTIPVTYKVTNNGTVTALPNWVDLAYLSSNGVLDTASVLLAGEHGRTTALAAGASYTVTVSYTTNTAVAPGNYTVFIKADGHDPSGSYHASISGYPTGTVTDNGNVAEANETNNAQGLAVTLSRPDLAVSNASIGTIVTNQNGTYTIPVTYKVTNNGTVTALPNWVDLAYLSSNGVLDTASVLLAGEHGRTTALAAGASYTVTVSYTTNTAVAPGNYTVFIKADGHDPSGSYHASISGYPTGTVTDNGNVAEANETNNAQGLAVTLSRPDLAVSNASIGTIVTNQNGTYTIPVTYKVTNNGTVTALPNWVDLAYLSSNGVLDTASVLLAGEHGRTTALAAGASYTVTVSYTTNTAVAPGNYTVFIKADGHDPSGSYHASISGYPTGTVTDNGNVAEANETNNAQGLAVTLSRPDLAVSNASIGTIVTNQNGTYTIPVTYKVTNNGTVTALPNWVDLAYLSSNGVLDTASVLLAGEHGRTTALAAGASYTVTVSYTTNTAVAPGNYTVFIKADGHDPSGSYHASISGYPTGTVTDNGNVAEANETNNAQGLAVTLP